jgi:hypothetical protein
MQYAAGTMPEVAQATGSPVVPLVLFLGETTSNYQSHLDERAMTVMRLPLSLVPLLILALCSFPSRFVLQLVCRARFLHLSPRAGLLGCRIPSSSQDSPHV